MAPKEHVYVVYETAEDGTVSFIEAHTSNDSAKAAAKALKSKAAVKKVELKSGAEEPSKADKAGGYGSTYPLICPRSH